MDEARLIAAALGGMVILLALIIGARLHAFVALLLASLTIGLGAGMAPAALIESMTTGMGTTLGAIAVLIGLGAMFGRMLETSGGAERIAQTLLRRFGERRAPWSLSFAGFLVAIPVFFDVAFVILVPIVYGLTERSGRSILYYALPLLAGLATTHAFIPPTPGPIAVAALLGADLGWVILFGASAGLPAAIIAGPVYGRLIASRIQAGVPEYMKQAEPAGAGAAPELPSIGLVGALIGIPIGLIVVNTVSAAVLPEASAARAVLGLVGDPSVALLVVTLLCFWLLGIRRGMSATEVQDLASKALEPAGIIILVTGAGGILKQVLIDSRVGEVLGNALAETALPPLLLGFVIAAVVRLMQGSATVAMMTGAGLLASFLGDAPISAPMRGLLVISVASGASIASHVNDSGFWLVNRYLGLSVPQTLKTWTVATTLVALVGLAVVLLLGTVIA